jgi:hypothetical protein
MQVDLDPQKHIKEARQKAQQEGKSQFVEYFNRFEDYYDRKYAF